MYFKGVILKCEWNLDVKMTVTISRILLFLILCLDFSIYFAKGDCIHNGREYLKHTVWQPGPCTVCTCEDPIVSCETIRCTDPQCDFDKGEYLQIPADSCCPECVPQLASCSYQDSTVPHNTEWSPEPCVTCICIDGEVTCTKVPCVNKQCRPGELSQTVPGQCCPQCIPSGKSCTYQGATHQDGSDWSPLPCTKCVCHDGQHSCFPIQCPSLVCAQDQVLETPMDACCPLCQGLNMTCVENSKEYKTGEQWNRDPCTLCVCIGGTVVCTRKECMGMAVCGRDYAPVTREGECCPECVAREGVCSDEVPVKYHGDIWNTSDCEYCACTDGQVQCHSVVCENIVCFKEEVLVHPEGTCCPQCVIPPTCEFAGQIIQDGERWYPDPCTVCYCNEGRTTCYTQHCPSCPDGSVTLREPGECCGTCAKVDCKPECAECSPGAPNNCTVCTNTQLYVQDGRCVHTCRMGYYASPSRVCMPCHETCYTCRSDTQYHCDMCQPGLMWKHGECVTQCGSGYFLQNGKCLQCDSSCKTCTGPLPEHCIACTNQAQVVFHGQCVDKCPDNFYIRAGKCVACHPTCKTCTSDGKGCATCWEGGLLHLGQCVTRCSIGYYSNKEGSCSPCHPSCESCKGGSNKNCTSCFAGGRVSKKGKCRNSCPRGQYLAVDGACRECETGCTECHEAWSGGTSICSGCETKNLVPSGSECLDKCRPGQFQEFKACKDCGENCLFCSSPTSCTKCIPSMLLQRGLCVEHCAQGQFEDRKTMTCRDCSVDCLSCYSEDECSVCSSLTYLKDGRCVNTCGEGHMPKPHSRECIRNTGPPVFQVLKHVKVEDSEIVTLDPSLFYTSDPDLHAEDLIIVVDALPENGDIIVTREGRDVRLNKGENFTVLDLEHGLVRFRHYKGNTQKGKAVLSLSDTQSRSQQRDLFFQTVSKSAITLAVRSVLHATEGEFTPITKHTLDLNTATDPVDLIITVIQGPSQGFMFAKHIRSTVHSFTLADLRAGVVGYKHHSREKIKSDLVELQASDGINLLTFLFHVEIRDSEDLAPIILHNKVGHVKLGEMLQISNDLLLAQIMDTEKAESEEVIYTLVPPLNNPQEGEIIMVVPIPPDGIGNGWEDMGDGNMAARMTRFLQRDIDEGRIFYKNRGNAALTDVVKFEVADTSSPAAVLPDQSLIITVREKTLSGLYTHPTLASDVRLGLIAMEGQLVPITSADLAFTDPDTAPNKIVYSITRPLSIKAGLLEHIEKPFHQVTKFTQEDVNSNRILYRPHDNEIGFKPRDAYFYFTVSDGEEKHTLEEHKFSIHILPVNNQPPRISTLVQTVHVSQGGSVPIGSSVMVVTDQDTPTSDLVQVENVVDTFSISDGEEQHTLEEHKFSIHILPVNNQPPRISTLVQTVHVSQGGSVPIGPSVMVVTDQDTPTSDLSVTLAKSPVAGTLEKADKGMKATLRQGDIFTYPEFEQGVFVYQHDGSGELNDGITLAVSDGEQSTAVTIQISIIRVDKASPYMLPQSSCRLVVTEGTSEIISREVLGFGDHDDSDSQLQIRLIQQTVHGKLLLRNRQVFVNGPFTQDDINNNHLSFLADSEIGDKPVTEVVLFNVTDSSGNTLPSQTLTVLIQPDNNQPPRVMVTPRVKVEEGDLVPLTSSDITVNDPDTPIDRLVIVIEQQPGFGAIKDFAPSEGSELFVDRLVTSLPYDDLVNGYIIYAQTNHKNKEPVHDTFLFHVTDGENKSPTYRFNITILPVNDEPPNVVTEQIFVHEGQTVSITNASIYVTDLDTPPTNIVLTIMTAPTSGVIRRKTTTNQPLSQSVVLQAGENFTYSDIVHELMVYSHDGSEVAMDSFSIHVSDGLFNETRRLSVIVGMINDETPRVIINRGLRVHSGSQTTITSSDLSSEDIDSENTQLIYTLTQDPRIGALYVTQNGQRVQVTARGPVTSFTQTDLNLGHVSYVHTRGETTGNILFKFTVSDPEGNSLIDQDFYINILEDRLPPDMLSNKVLTVPEDGKMTITTDYLSFTDGDTAPSTLHYMLINVPKLGHLELTNNPGVPLQEFTQADIAANHVVYVHTSVDEVYHDTFTFSVSDGINEIVRTFTINISPIDDSIPLVTMNGLLAQEGIRKLISEFDLKAVDPDTKEDSVIFTVVDPPVHGTIQHLERNIWIPTTVFTMAEIYDNKVSYLHDGTETLTDKLKFTVSDGTNNKFAVMNAEDKTEKPLEQSGPLEFEISILPLDDGSPILTNNLGLQFLEVSGSTISNIITSRELKATDTDTQPDRLKYVIRTAPQSGRLEKTDNTGVDVLSFTQDDINNGLIRYVLTDKDALYQDSFTFDLYDSKPHRVPGNVFHITWSSVSFAEPLINVTETVGVIQVPIKRHGNLKQYSIVTCRTLSGTALSSEQGSRPGQQDFVQHVGQVQFDEWQESKTCTIIINDDSIFEGSENFYVELIEPVFTLIGSVPKSTVNILDMEDEPVLEFQQAVYHVNESDSYLSASIVRTGDFSSTVSTICFTTTLTARGSPLDRLDTGSDYISRGNSNSYRVVFPSGVTVATCDVKLIDDSVQEASEQFELELSLPSYGAKLGQSNRATVIIEGPNDESVIFFSDLSYHFDENAGTVDIEITRFGADLSHTSTVWCATRLSTPPSASSGQDYIPSSSQITFGPGQTTQKCQLTILDDDLDPRVEGDETFTLFLSSAIGSSLVQPYIATVHIYDGHLDIPKMSFESDTYTIDESAESLSVPIFRSGDVTFESSVICYTRQNTAAVMSDYIERTLTEESRIYFRENEKVKNCTVEIVDDQDYEKDELFLLKLARPIGIDTEAELGGVNVTQITVTNKDDVPTLSFEKSAYSIPEPSSKDQIATVNVKVVRSGDLSKTANVRCSTRDGSAMSGTDYNPRSQVLEFKPGVKELNFPVDILYNSDIEWHETFTIMLGPGDPVGAELGTRFKTTITILDNDVSGSMVLPAPPVVVSLLKYDDVETGMKVDPSPGYPVVCITPCDKEHPSYSVTKSMCKETKINQTAMYYRWEVAMPDSGNTRPPFVEISYNTLFTSVNHKVLDSIYYRPSFKIRCIAQPLDDKGNPGIPLKSTPVTIGRENGICKAPVFSGLPFSYQAQSFHAKLEYAGTEDKNHPNTIHISIKVPHQDGMLPLISTFPINNLRFVLSEPIYRQQHICSNIITPQERKPLLESGFLQNGAVYPSSMSAGFDFPHQFDASLRENATLLLYKHLDLQTCIWTFEAWYHMSDLVDLCGGRAVSDFQVTDQGQTYLSVRVPLFVSYLYAVAPIGWGSLEHRTELEFSFYYDTVLWRSGLETQGELAGNLQVMRILIGDDGKLVVDFKTHAKFRGLFVLNHHTLEGYTSRVVSIDKSISFDLNILWSQNTFDGPVQLWRATSDYSLKDYTGEYTVELIPCTVQSNQGYTIQTPLPCTAHHPTRFQVPIAFQQTNRPVPLEYTLNTHFQLSNNERMFLKDPFTGSVDMEDMDVNVAFSKDDKLFGRVLWSPEQDLKEAYSIAIEKVFICAGRDGYIPTYDPSGINYNNGPQYGCIQPTTNLKYRFLILDRGAPDVTTRHFHNVPFEAEFASENPLYSSLLSITGVDGFIISVNPLYKVTAGFQWYIQVFYTIGPSDPSLQQYRSKRSTFISVDRHKRNIGYDVDTDADWLDNNSSKNGTNIKILRLNNTQIVSDLQKAEDINTATIVILPIVFIVIIIIVAIIIFIVLRKRKRRRRKPPKKQSNIELAKQNSVIYTGNQNNIVKLGSSCVELKETSVHAGDRGKTLVRVKDTNIKTDKNISKGNGTEV